MSLPALIALSIACVIGVPFAAFLVYLAWTDDDDSHDQMGGWQ